MVEKLNKKLWQIISITLFALIIVFVIVFNIKLVRLNKELKDAKSNIKIVYDTIYDKTNINNIQQSINEKEKDINNYQNELNYEINKITKLDDSATVKLFYQLLSEL